MITGSVITLIVAIAVGIVGVSNVQAQGGWTPPAVIPMMETPTEELSNLGTSLAVDSTGMVHVIWRGHPSSTDQTGFLYYYSRWDGQNWTPAIDVFAATADIVLTVPELIAGSDGRLLLYWATPNGIFHSSAWATEAESARAWSTPDVVLDSGQPLTGQMSVKIDDHGVLHIVYAVTGDSVYYVRSENDGGTWTNPVPVSRVAQGISTWRPRLDIDEEGRIHVIWTEWELSNEAGPYQSVGVYYAQSSDGGATWSEPRQAGGFANSDGNVLATNDGYVFLAWNGGVAAGGGRYLQVSRDSGHSWDSPVEFSRGIGQSGYPSLVLDGAAKLHILEAGGGYSQWIDGALTPERLILSPEVSAEDSRLALANGNQLLAVFAPYGGWMYASTQRLLLPTIPTVMPPTRVPVLGKSGSGSSLESVPTSVPTPVSTMTATPSLPPARSNTSAMSAILLSSGLSLALVVGVVVIRSRRTRR